MDNISQEEIDALIDEAAEAEDAPPVEEAESDSGPLSEEPEVLGSDDGLVYYDFNRPHSLSRAFERSVRGICESYAKGATLSFSNLVRANAVFTFGGLKLASFGEAFASVENPSCIAVVTMEPLKGACLVTVDAGMMFALFTKLLGGPIEAAGQVRDFTEIEMNMARKVMNRVLDNFHVAAEKVLEITPEVTQIENNPNYLNLYPDGETVLNLQYSIAIDEVVGVLSFFIPLNAFEPVREIFDPKEGIGRAGQRDEERRQVESVVSDMPATVSVRMKARTMAVEDLVRLAVDDVLELTHPVGCPLDILVEGEPMFEASLGQVGQTRALRVVSRTEE